MRRRLRSHLTYANVMSTLGVFLVLGGTTYAATGGNFILGQSNTAGAPTVLSSPTTNSNGALKVANTSTTTPGRGITAIGGHGGFGLWASGGDASQNKAAIHAQSSAGNAVEGISGKNIASGVYGQNNSTGFGVAGRSTNGTGVMGDSSGGWAMQAFGNATQTRTGNGFVKAMALVNPGNPSDPIQQCFNSQLPPGQATLGNCGISTSLPTIGTIELDFGFQVTDRIAMGMAQAGSINVTAFPFDQTKLNVDLTSGGNPALTGFYIVVY